MVLGITAASVILALTGCASSPISEQPSAAPAQPDSATAFEPFSESERERIVAVQGIVEKAAAEHGIDPDLINAVIWVESKFEPDAKSSAGARGLMQLMPATAAYLAKRMGEHNPRSFDPEFNVRAGSLYLAEMIDKFGDERYAVAAYHAGPGNVKKWIESGTAFPDYSDAYVAKVMDARERFEGGERHGGTNERRKPAPAAANTPAKSPPEDKSQPQPESSEDESEPLEPPPLDTLPDAAEIHGIARVVYSEPAPQTEPQPVVQAHDEPLVDEEPVFAVHRELDANPNMSTGWVSAQPTQPQKKSRQRARAKPPESKAPAATEQPNPEQPKPEPEPEPKPEPKPEPSDVAALGVLPDL